MAKAVKPKRRYDATRRREQAAATRLEILDAAERLFMRDGYGATTMAAIAAEARVASKTVYLAFDTKSGLLRALWNLRLRGGDEDVPITEHPFYIEALEERDPTQRLRMNARNSRLGKERIGMLADVIRAAAPLDPEIAALWARIEAEYHANQAAIVDGLAKRRALKRGLSAERAADILWTINHPSTWLMLVGERGWSPDDYEQWSFDAACRELLR